MKLSIKKTTEQTVDFEINEHMFFKEVTGGTIKEYVAVIEECTLEVWSYPEVRTQIENAATEDRALKISKCLDKWERISEEEFFEALDNALKDFDFKPKAFLTCKESNQVIL